ncbi:putative membrane protein [Lysobacter antibioticus]|nr:putative membrane protein [Lysobacter antibioticus]
MIKGFLGLSLLAFIVCLVLPAYTVGSASSEMHSGLSYEKLLMGFLGPLIGVFEWYANPALLLSWLLLWKKHFIAGAIFAAVALVTGGAFLFRHEIIINEAGHSGTILSKDVGYWLWIASMAIALIGNATCSFRARMNPT